MKRRLVSGMAVLLLLMSIGMVASVWAVNDYDILIEIIPSSVLQGGTVTFRIHADIVGFDDYNTPNGALDYVSVRGYTAPDTSGIFVHHPDGTITQYSGPSPIVIQNGVPDENGDYFEITFGTNAPDKDSWLPMSTTDIIGQYSGYVDGFLYMTDGSVHWFNIHFDFTVMPPDGEYEGYTPGWWGSNVAKLLGYKRGATQITLEGYEAAVDCVYASWSSELDWLPTSAQEAYDIFEAKPKNNPIVKARIHLLCHLLTICHFGTGGATPVTVTGPLGTLAYTPADWATFLINLYNTGDYGNVVNYANVLNNL
jgi:hypothetical protein